MTYKSVSKKPDNGQYEVVYADPPWDQKNGTALNGYTIKEGKQVWSRNGNKPRVQQYPTMSVEEICRLPVKNISARNSVLFMWVTNKYLMLASDVIAAWGFTYVATIVWKKKKMGGGMGGRVRITSEYLLFCERGSLPSDGIIPESVIEAKREYVNGKPYGSKKPHLFRKMIEDLYPSKKRLEMFAREHRPSWDVFGNEIENSIQL